MKTKTLFQALALALLVLVQTLMVTPAAANSSIVVGYYSASNTLQAGWNGTAYVGLKAPFAKGATVTITGDRTTHGGTDRHAVDIGMTSMTVHAIHGGTVMAYKPNNGAAGNELDIDHGDGYCSAYLHLESVRVQKGQPVKQGDPIAVSGNTGGVPYHLHVEVDRIVNGSCNTDTPSTPEVPMYFDEIPSRELNKGDKLTSSQEHYPPDNFIWCANEEERCNFSGTAEVVYGAYNSFTSPRSFTDGVTCNNTVFVDPISGIGKSCYYKQTPPPPICPSSITGWQAEFFNNITGSEPMAACLDVPNVDFNWGESSPAPNVSADNFSARFIKTVDFAEGDYIFHLASDDGSTLYIDKASGKGPLIDAWEINGSSEHSVHVYLTGGSHTILVGYHDLTSFASVKLWWEGPLPPGPSISTVVNPTSIDKGNSTTATASLANVPVEGYTSAEFTCTYDPAFVEVGGVVETGLFGADAVMVSTAPANGGFIVAIAGSNGRKATTSGNVFTFNAKGLQVGQTPIKCDARVSKGDGALTQIASMPAALLTIIDQGPTGGSLTGKVIATKPVKVCATDVNNAEKCVDANTDGSFNLPLNAGAYKVVATAEGFLEAENSSVTVEGGKTTTMDAISLHEGDLDGDGDVDNYDAMTIGMNYNATAPAVADLNNDGSINVLDLELLADHYRETASQPTPWNWNIP